MYKKILYMSIAVMMIVALCGQTIYATTSSEIQEQLNQAEEELEQNQNELEEIEGNISALEGEQSEIDGEIDALTEEIIGLMASIQLLEDDIAVKEKEIEQAQKDLDAAIVREQQQYEDTMVRLQAMYEKGDDSYITMLLESQSLTDMLTRLEYIQKVYDYDNQLLAEYEQIKLEVAALKETLEIEESELLAAKEECENEQAELEGMVAELQILSDDYAAQIASAERLASDYARRIRNQNAQIRQLEQERQEALKKEEEERKRQEEEERKRQEELANQNNANNNGSSSAGDGAGVIAGNTGGDNSNGGSTNTGNSSTGVGGGNNVSTENGGNAGGAGGNSSVGTTQSSGGSQFTGSQYTLDPAVITGANGSDAGKTIALYAIQFLGNPYVMGGTSLTNGADCSGFTQTVFGNCGYSIPRTSYSQRSAGVEVSYADAQPGDIICYAGHVAIYVGGGQIVHASSARTGIKISPATYRTILCVRRIV